ncbi:FadR/GntR family transcriptional regulator [Tessaracoccus terricola]
MYDKLSHDQLVMQIVKHLRSRGIKDGMALPSEASLMSELGLGRQQLREALRVLEGFGAVEARQGARRRWRGVHLGELVSLSAQLIGSPEQTLAELLAVRQALETSMLAKVIQLHTPSSLDELMRIGHRMEDRAHEGESFADLDEQFHLGLFAPLRNSTLEGILGAFWTLLDVVEHESRTVAVDPVVAEMHTAIVEAIVDGDYDLAVHELDTHFYGVRRRVSRRNTAGATAAQAHRSAKN